MTRTILSLFLALLITVSVLPVSEADGAVHLMSDNNKVEGELGVEDADDYDTAADLKAVGASYDSTTLLPGGTLTVTITVENVGKSSIQLAAVRILQEETVLGETQVNSLPAPGKTGSVHVQARLPETLPDSLTAEIKLLSDTDADLTNNRVTLTLNLHDAAVEDVTSAVIAKDGTVETVVQVCNRGYRVLTNVSVGLYAGSETGNAAAAAQTIVSLDPGSTETLRFVSTAEQLAAGDLVYAVATGPETEISLTNNLRSARVQQTDPEPSLPLQLYTSTEPCGDLLQVLIDVENPADVPVSVYICAVLYDGKKMEELLLFTPCELAAGSLEALEPLTVVPAENRTVKVMLLDSTYAPLLQCHMLQADDAWHPFG